MHPKISPRLSVPTAILSARNVMAVYKRSNAPFAGQPSTSAKKQPTNINSIIIYNNPTFTTSPIRPLSIPDKGLSLKIKAIRKINRSRVDVGLRSSTISDDLRPSLLSFRQRSGLYGQYLSPILYCQAILHLHGDWWDYLCICNILRDNDGINVQQI